MVAAHKTLKIALAALLLQTLIPTGYMPASLASGWFVMLCPDGLTPAAMHTISGDHHHHHAHDDESYERCEFGAASAPLVSNDWHNHLPGAPTSEPQPLAESIDASNARPYRPQQARSPPRSRPA